MEILRSSAPSTTSSPKNLLKWDDNEAKVVQHISKAKDFIFFHFIIFCTFEYYVGAIFALAWMSNYWVLKLCATG